MKKSEKIEFLESELKKAKAEHDNEISVYHNKISYMERELVKVQQYGIECQTMADMLFNTIQTIKHCINLKEVPDDVAKGIDVAVKSHLRFRNYLSQDTINKLH